MNVEIWIRTWPGAKCFERRGSLEGAEEGLERLDAVDLKPRERDTLRRRINKYLQVCADRRLVGR